ncbi:MAG TPA: crossover junction endodeoxyribonuclease RuvC, partial [Longimicrobiales bacterium]|nr:crossover junction endodeoxyribonuclease RuvC [Longimicrobiales bacterium]
GVVTQASGGAVSLLECGVIRTAASTPLPERLKEIYLGISEVIARQAPTIVAVEGVFYGKNVRTTVILGHARGAVLLAATMHDLAVTEYSPAQIKNAIVGHGRAGKDQVQYMVQRLLRLKTMPQPADAADGVAVALCHCNAAALDRLRVATTVLRPARVIGR